MKREKKPSPYCMNRMRKEQRTEFQKKVSNGTLSLCRYLIRLFPSLACIMDNAMLFSNSNMIFLTICIYIRFSKVTSRHLLHMVFACRS